MRFPRKNRLLTKADFRQVFSGHKASRDQFFRVLGRANERENCRLGMAVARKNCKRAVDRNRLKRVIRENFRQCQQELTERGAFDFVVLPTAQAATICNRKLSESLTRHWRIVQGEQPGPAGTGNRKI